MRQSKAVGRTVGSARRVVLTSLGASLAVGAAAPIASAATVADETPIASSAAIASPAEAAHTAPLTSAPLASSAEAAHAAPLTSAPLGSSAGVLQAAPLAMPLTSMGSAASLANSALTLSTAALSGTALSNANANWSHLGHLKLYPLAGTGIDPLSNMVSTSLGGIPVSTQPVSQMVSDGLPVSDLPVVGDLFGTPKD